MIEITHPIITGIIVGIVSGIMLGLCPFISLTSSSTNATEVHGPIYIIKFRTGSHDVRVWASCGRYRGYWTNRAVANQACLDMAEDFGTVGGVQYDNGGLVKCLAMIHNPGAGFAAAPPSHACYEVVEFMKRT